MVFFFGCSSVGEVLDGGSGKALRYCMFVRE